MICPILSAGRGNESYECEGTFCQWWIQDKQDCLAKVFVKTLETMFRIQEVTAGRTLPT